MEAVFVHAGHIVNHTPTTALAAGQVVVLGELVAVATYPVEANQTCGLAVQGVFDFAKGSTAIALGALVYWDDAANIATTTATGNKLIGKVIRAAAASDSRVRVLLTP